VPERARREGGLRGDVAAREAHRRQAADGDEVAQLLVAGGHRASPFTTSRTISATRAAISSAARMRWPTEACGSSSPAPSPPPSTALEAASALRISSTETIDLS